MIFYPGGWCGRTCRKGFVGIYAEVWEYRAMASVIVPMYMVSSLIDNI